MPRLSNALIARAQRIHPYLALLLRPCRELDSARNELRWLREYVKQLRTNRKPGGPQPPQLWDLCKERSRGRPLQYILGTQPFGELEILCRKGVLIPRPETEATTVRLAQVLKQTFVEMPQKSLYIVDAGTGSGCIALLLYDLLHKSIPNLTIHATDISKHALRLAKRNLEWNIARGSLPVSARSAISISSMDITRPTEWKAVLRDAAKADFKVLVSNPPYISPHDLRYKTERSARLYEPRAALAGEPPLYNFLNAWLLRLAKWLRALLTLIEVDGGTQAFPLLRYLWSVAPKNSRGSRFQFDLWDNQAKSVLHPSRLTINTLRVRFVPGIRHESIRALLLYHRGIRETFMDHTMTYPLSLKSPQYLPEFHELRRHIETLPSTVALVNKSNLAGQALEVAARRQKEIIASSSAHQLAGSASPAPFMISELEPAPLQGGETADRSPVRYLHTNNVDAASESKVGDKGSDRSHSQHNTEQELLGLRDRVKNLEERETEIFKNFASLWQEQQHVMEDLVSTLQKRGAGRGGKKLSRHARQRRP